MRCLFIHIYSPDNTRHVYRLDVIGSNVSMLPNIYDVDAVGIGAISKEFLTPYCLICYHKVVQSQLS